jgi:hypothetical protein
MMLVLGEGPRNTSALSVGFTMPSASAAAKRKPAG